MLARKSMGNSTLPWGAYGVYDGLNVSYSPTDSSKNDAGNPISIGAPNPDRYLCFLIRLPVQNGATDLTGVSVGGVNLTQIYTTSDYYSKTYIYIGNVPAGTTANVTYTVDTSTFSWDINGTVFAFYGDYTVQDTAGSIDPSRSFSGLSVTAGESIVAFVVGSQGHSSASTAAITSSSPQSTGVWERISSNSSGTTVCESWVIQPEDVTTTTTAQTATIAFTGDSTPQYSSICAISILPA